MSKSTGIYIGVEAPDWTFVLRVVDRVSDDVRKVCIVRSPKPLTRQELFDHCLDAMGDHAAKASELFVTPARCTSVMNCEALFDIELIAPLDTPDDTDTQTIAYWWCKARAHHGDTAVAEDRIPEDRDEACRAGIDDAAAGRSLGERFGPQWTESRWLKELPARERELFATYHEAYMAELSERQPGVAPKVA